MRLVEIIVGLAAALAIVWVAAIAIRRLLIARAGGFDVIWRRADAVGAQGWALGQARYRRRSVAVYRSFSPLPFAALTLDRSALVLSEMRTPDDAEQGVLPDGVTILTGSSGAIRVELALSIDAVTTLRAWVESRPPGLGPLPGRNEVRRNQQDAPGGGDSDR